MSDRATALGASGHDLIGNAGHPGGHHTRPDQPAEDRARAPAASGRADNPTRLARNRARQREIYGEPLGDRFRRFTQRLGVTQARLADALGLSRAMLCQLASAQRVKIGDPGVLARMELLERYLRGPRPGVPTARGEAVLAHVKHSRPRLAMPDSPPDTPVEALRAVADPAELAAAANILGPRFPALAQLLRRAATPHPRRPR